MIYFIFADCFLSFQKRAIYSVAHLYTSSNCVNDNYALCRPKVYVVIFEREKKTKHAEQNGTTRANIVLRKIESV